MFIDESKNINGFGIYQNTTFPNETDTPIGETGVGTAINPPSITYTCRACKGEGIIRLKDIMGTEVDVKKCPLCNHMYVWTKQTPYWPYWYGTYYDTNKGQKWLQNEVIYCNDSCKKYHGKIE